MSLKEEMAINFGTHRVQSASLQMNYIIEMNKLLANWKTRKTLLKMKNLFSASLADIHFITFESYL